MRNFSNLLLFVLLILVSCTNRKPANEKTEAIQPDSLKQEILEIDPRQFENNELSVANFAEAISYKPLSNKIRLGRIIKLKLTSKAIYVVSDASSGGEGNGMQTLVRFDNNGQNPIQIGRNGRNDLALSSFVEDDIEYIQLETNVYCLIDKNIRLFLNDSVIIAIAQKQVFLIDRNSGKFIREIGHVGNPILTIFFNV